MTLNECVIVSGRLLNEIRQWKHITHIDQYLLGEGRRTDGVGITLYPRGSITLTDLESKVNDVKDSCLPWDWKVKIHLDKDIFGYGDNKQRRLYIRILKVRDEA